MIINKQNIVRMNRICLYIVLLLCVLCSCNGSNEEYKMPTSEFPPINLYFTCTNDRGQDMLNPQTKGNILDDDLFVLFRGTKYRLDELSDKSPNEDDSPVVFRGLKLSQLDDGRYALAFGALDGSYYYKDERFTMQMGHVPYGVYIYSIWVYLENGMPDFYRRFYKSKTDDESLAENTASPVFDVLYYEELPM